jgi:hypothetical protein
VTVPTTLQSIAGRLMNPFFGGPQAMALILKKKESGYRNWYEKNKQGLSAKRKKRYAEDSEYRQRQLERSRRRRSGELTPMTPPEDAPISFAEAAERIGIDPSTLHHYRKKKYFPEPKRHNGRRLWFSEAQLVLLKNLKDFFRVHRKKAWKVKLARLKEVKDSIFANWK